MTSPVDSHMLRVFFYNYSTGVRNLSLNDSDIHAPPLVALIPLWQKVSIGVVLTIMIGSTLLGNVLVILAVVLEKKLRTFNNYFFASLGMADLIIATIVMPLAMLVQLNGGVWYYGKRTCDLFIFLDVSCCTASILNLCAISLNRYWSITSPLKYAAKQTCRRAAVMITVVWAASFLIACPPLFGWPQRSPAPHSCEHNQNYIYIFYSSMGSFYIPVMVLTIVYCRIYRVSKRGAKFRRETTVLPYIHGSSSANSMGKTIKLRHINSKLSMTDYETSYKNVLLSKNRKETTDGNQGFKTCKRIVRNKKDPIKNAERKTAKTLGKIKHVSFS
uniref:Octopamine receptor-like n=1 Tax=Saccoglossus kowalevskii TaxID=10224 RepID=A0ABM0MWE8_SACKO|nr:PREDICTED: octopamine receptor-like [Saccoglossus kowalevskii]